MKPAYLSIKQEYEQQEEDSDEEEMVAKRHARGVLVRLCLRIPIVGFAVTQVVDFFTGQIQEILRRRRSFKLALFYQTQMFVGIAGFLLFFVLAVIDLAYLKNTSSVSAECSVPSSATLSNGTSIAVFDASATAVDMDSMHAYAVNNRVVLDCSNDSVESIDAACSLTQFQTILILMLTCSILFLIASITSQVVASGFKFFSNLPMESLDVDALSYKVSFLGAACKYGPWAARTLTVITITFAITLTILPTASNMCLGTMKSTHQCVNMYDDCVYYKILNCRYYYSDNCVGTYLPHASSQSSNFLQCRDPSFASTFSGRMDIRLVHPTPCSRCWALHFDCKDAAINNARLTKDTSSAEFVYYTSKYTESPAISSTQSTLGSFIYCQCMEGLDKVGTSTENQKILYFDPSRLVSNSSLSSNSSSFCANYNSTSACDLSSPIAAPSQSYSADADWWSENWDDTVAGTTASQQCSWGPTDDSLFYYESTECDQAGSELNRYVFIVSYVTITFTALLLLAGVSVRYTVQPETWSYSPQLKDEPWYWILLRQLGPG